LNIHLILVNRDPCLWLVVLYLTWLANPSPNFFSLYYSIQLIITKLLFPHQTWGFWKTSAFSPYNQTWKVHHISNLPLWNLANHPSPKWSLVNLFKLLQIWPPKSLISNTKTWWTINNMKNLEQNYFQWNVWW
jgi:hypothetical protein